MMRKITIGLVIVIAAMCVTGCRSSEKTTSTIPVSTQEYYTINFSGEAEGISFNGQLRMAKDSVIWCNFSKIIDLGRAMATRDSVWVNIPLLGRNEAGDYDMVRRLTGVNVTYNELQAILMSNNTEEEIRRLAKRMGHNVSVRIKKRERVDTLTFPFNK